ncbi:hypothetical protein HYPSUDRAFT_207389 [Hypholoma sublateritium FD-334 SS-4]|uniref:Uncharacterized protein n=1 Tax=Hypholoma sublateritium (strain FD-334 SS-4) TaxID=945553 RepID=A0A0D2NA19_HYPSF|nr:hypothetical protein HYPSUDRAFT_207389 [Hypholoma sublateritium FD-334 SS-4]
MNEADALAERHSTSRTRRNTPALAISPVALAVDAEHVEPTVREASPASVVPPHTPSPSELHILPPYPATPTPGASLATAATISVDETCRNALFFALGRLMQRDAQCTALTCDHATSQAYQSLSPPKSPRTLQPQGMFMLPSVLGDKNIPSICATPPALPSQMFSKPEYIFCAVSGRFAPFSADRMRPIATGDLASLRLNPA